MSAFTPISEKNKVLVQGFLSGLNIRVDNQYTELGLKREKFRELFLNQRKTVEEGFELIPKELIIRKVSGEDIQRIEDSPMGWSFGKLPHFEDVMIEWFVENEDYEERPALIDHAVLALSLFKNGFFDLEKYWIVSLNESSYELDGFKVRIYQDNEGYVLFPKDIENLKNMLNQIRNVDFNKHRAFAIACRRFEQSYDDPYSEDRIVDMYIAFEALYFKDKSYRSKGVVIGEKASKILSDDLETQKQINDILVNGYRLRNDIVHGDKVDIDRCLSIGNYIEEYLRHSIVKLMPIS